MPNENENENEFTVSVTPTADLGGAAEQPTGRKSSTVVHRTGLLPQETLDWAGPPQAGESYGRGPAVRPPRQRPEDSGSGGSA
jgi:hypothetical protein